MSEEEPDPSTRQARTEGRPSEEPLDYSPSSGAGDWADATKDAQNPDFVGPGSPAATKFYPDDVDGEKAEKFRRLRKMQHVSDPNMADEQREHRREWSKVDLNTFADRLNLPDRCTTWVANKLDEIEDLNEFAGSAECVMLALISIWFNRIEGYSIRPKSEFSDERTGRTQAFESIRQECNVERKGLKRARDRLVDAV